MDLFPETNETENQNEYIIVKSKNTNLHRANMPENFKLNTGNNNSSRDNTNIRIDKDLIIKKQRVTDSDSKDIIQYVMEDKDDNTKKGSHHDNRYIGREKTSDQRFLVFYRKDKDIKLCSLASTVSFKRDQQLKSVGVESMKKSKPGRQVGIKTLLKNQANKKDEEKEKEKEKEKDKDKEKEDDDDASQKSWSDEDDSDLETNNGTEQPKGKDKKKKEMKIKDIFEEAAVVEPAKKPTQTKASNAKKNDKEPSDQQSAGDNADNESDSSFDFEEM